MKTEIRQVWGDIARSRAYFAVFKMPVILFTAIFGFILEFVIELPFMVLCLIDRRRPTIGTLTKGENKEWMKG